MRERERETEYFHKLCTYGTGNTEIGSACSKVLNRRESIRNQKREIQQICGNMSKFCKREGKNGYQRKTVGRMKEKGTNFQS
jgi:hypothetical protein